ncbi:MAG: UDP-N-acetylmuramoyl-L-alanine--D-glutamate ligase [Nitrospirota bacterium]|nr:UDP-N-acetylmuramoyl-L-alanine--D-glutamate ligase [Nitrospirota bacterium]
MSAIQETLLERPSLGNIGRVEVGHTKMKKLQGKVVAVMGLGKSGVAAARLLYAVGSHVVLVDQKPAEELPDEVLKLKKQDMSLWTGENFTQGFEGADLVVMSPGVPMSLPAIEQVRSKGMPVIGEVELASWFLPVPVIAVTGTNGKSTTVSLIGRILEESGHRPFIGGNLGTPLSDAALSMYEHDRLQNDRPLPFSMAVVEVSSFQLESIAQFHPHIAAVLNVTPDHLDRYASVSDYTAAKGRIFEQQTTQDYAVLNMDDPQLDSFREKSLGAQIGFSTKKRVERGVYLDGDTIIATVKGKYDIVMRREDILLPGSHNVANVLAAVTVGILCDCPIEFIRRAVSSFTGVGHALQIVRQRHGVMYVDDSKGTNADATVKALESFECPVVIILGGKNKGGDFSKLREPLAQRAKQVILIGEATAELQRVLAGIEPMVQVQSLKEAVLMASQVARSGDVVLLSPACASFDMFRDYRDRGEQFQVCVNDLPE